MNDQQEKFSQKLAASSRKLASKLKHRLVIEIAVIVLIALIAAFFIISYECGEIACLCSF